MLLVTAFPVTHLNDRINSPAFGLDLPGLLPSQPSRPCSSPTALWPCLLPAWLLVTPQSVPSQWVHDVEQTTLPKAACRTRGPSLPAPHLVSSLGSVCDFPCSLVTLQFLPPSPTFRLKIKPQLFGDIWTKLSKAAPFVALYPSPQITNGHHLSITQTFKIQRSA